MDENLTSKRLVVLRKLTRAIADFVRGQLKEHLTALAPLFRPRSIFADFVKSDVIEVSFKPTYASNICCKTRSAYFFEYLINMLAVFHHVSETG